MEKNNHQLPEWDIQVISPGRVNLLGEHVDYNQGMVLPIAIDRCVRLAARPRRDDLVSIESIDLKQTVSFDLGNLDQKIDIDGRPLPAWALYPAGVAWVMREKGFELGGLDVVLTSDLPMGAGLSSSAALELAFGLAWQTAGELKLDRMQLARICQLAESRYVGVNCGLMDQFACAHGVARHVLLFDTRTLFWQPLPMPPETVVVIADSGIRRELSDSAYNQRRQICSEAFLELKEHIPGIHALRDVTVDMLNEFENCLTVEMRKRVRHVVEEIERVQRACVCLTQDDAAGFGRLMTEGHVSLRDLYEVSLPELDKLVVDAMKFDGCFGARMTGAGFGGCTVNLVESGKAPAFIEQLRERSQSYIKEEAAVYLCRPYRGTHLLGT